MFTVVCVCEGLNAEHEFQVWVTILGRKSCHLICECVLYIYMYMYTHIHAFKKYLHAVYITYVYLYVIYIIYKYIYYIYLNCRSCIYLRSP